jgi:DNA polymerase III subunit gamma/tau
MSYQVLARKWRPRNFAELMGQEHVVRALTGGLNEGRLHHAFLFTGTRGVGKTTIARIIAKALNCETGITASPCGQCGSCKDIDAGRFPDLIEIDAASRTKVDDTREILDNVIYAPSRGRFKVYLIDEVHMLSTHSFNALLKTLEEPPEHVKFLLATTDPQKLPVTVLSRCLKFHLKRLSIPQISQQMRHILDAEGITFEADAIDELARSADGSMRDGLSLLDQALAFGGGRVDTDATREMLGTISREAVLDLLEALAAGDALLLSEKLATLADFGGSYVQVLARMMEQLHQLAFLQVVGAQSKQLVDVPPRLAALVPKFSPEDLQIKFQFANLGAKEVASAPDAKIAFEMCLLRMLAFADIEDANSVSGGTFGGASGRHGSTVLQTQSPAGIAIAPQSTITSNRTDAAEATPRQHDSTVLPPESSEVIAKPTQFTTSNKPEAELPQSTPAAIATKAVAAQPLKATADTQSRENIDLQSNETQEDSLAAYLAEISTKPTPEKPQPASTEVATELPERWRNLVRDLALPSGPLRELAHNAVARSWRAGALNLTVDAAHEGMAGEANVQALRSAIQRHLVEPLALNILVEDADLSASPASALAREYASKTQEFIDSIANRPLIQALIKQLDARIVPGSMQFIGT